MKKTAKILTVMSTALLLNGFGVEMPSLVNAAPPPPPAMERVAPQVRIDTEMQQISDMYGIDKATLMSYYNEG